MAAINETVDQVKSVEKYKYGFVTDIESEVIQKGINKNVIQIISVKKNEPSWLLK